MLAIAQTVHIELAYGPLSRKSLLVCLQFQAVICSVTFRDVDKTHPCYNLFCRPWHCPGLNTPVSRNREDQSHLTTSPSRLSFCVACQEFPELPPFRLLFQVLDLMKKWEPTWLRNIRETTQLFDCDGQFLFRRLLQLSPHLFHKC